jgi:hypothetical protein
VLAHVLVGEPDPLRRAMRSAEVCGLGERPRHQHGKQHRKSANGDVQETAGKPGVMGQQDTLRSDAGRHLERKNLNASYRARNPATGEDRGPQIRPGVQAGQRGPTLKSARADAEIGFVWRDDEAIGSLAWRVPLLNRGATRGADEFSGLSGHGSGFGAPVLRAALTLNVEHSHPTNMLMSRGRYKRASVQQQEKVRSEGRSSSHPHHNDANSIRLAFLQHPLHRFHVPVFIDRQYPDSAVIRSADQRMGACLIVDANQLEVVLGLPVEGDVEIAGKDSPFRAVIQLDNMALGMSADFQVLSDHVGSGGAAITVGAGMPQS